MWEQQKFNVTEEPFLLVSLAVLEAQEFHPVPSVRQHYPQKGLLHLELQVHQGQLQDLGSLWHLGIPVVLGLPELLAHHDHPGHHLDREILGLLALGDMSAVD